MLNFIKRNLYLERIVQIYLGVFLLSNVPVGWLVPLAELKLPPDAEQFFLQLWQINILMPTVKLIELVTAVMLIVNWKPWLGLLVFYPVLFNIVVMSVHFFGSLKYSALMITAVFYLSWKYKTHFMVM